MVREIPAKQTFSRQGVRRRLLTSTSVVALGIATHVIAGFDRPDSGQASEGTSLRRSLLGMHMIAPLLLAPVMLARSFVRAQGTPPIPDDPAGKITVTGTGLVTVIPDVATISLGVESQSRKLETAQTDNSTKVAAILKSFTGAGIDTKDIQTAAYSVDPVRKYDDGQRRYTGISGYEVSTTLSVVVRDMTQVGKLIDRAIRDGANQIHGISFSVDDPTGATSQARQGAVEDARAKAEALASAAGVVVTGVYSINETSGPASTARRYALSVEKHAMIARSASREVPVSAGSDQIRVDVQIVFETTSANR